MHIKNILYHIMIFAIFVYNFCVWFLDFNLIMLLFSIAAPLIYCFGLYKDQAAWQQEATISVSIDTQPADKVNWQQEGF